MLYNFTKYKKKAVAIVTLIASIFIISTFFINSLLADEDVSIYFSPSSLITPPDSSTSLMLDATVNELGFVALTVSFDNTLINLSEPIIVSSEFGNIIEQTSVEDANLNGSIRVVAALTTDQRETPPTGVIQLMDINFTPITEEANLVSSFTVVPEDVQIVSISETELTFASSDALLTINPQETPTPTASANPSPGPSVSPTPTATPSPNTAILELRGDAESFIGESHQIELFLNTSADTSGVDAVINYDPSVLRVDSFTPNNLLGTDSFESIDEINGIIRFSQVAEPESSFTGEGVLGTLNVTPLSIGNTDLTFDFTVGLFDDTNVISIIGEDVLTEAINYNLDITEHVLADISLLTESQNTELGHSTEATFFIAETSYEQTINTDTLGEVNDLQLDDNLADLTTNTIIKVDGYLAKTQQVGFIPGTNIIDFGLLTAGDLNDDGIVNTLDIAIMYEGWFRDGPANYNKDSLVNSFDYWILVQNFFESI